MSNYLDNFEKDYIKQQYGQQVASNAQQNAQQIQQPQIDPVYAYYMGAGQQQEQPTTPQNEGGIFNGFFRGAKSGGAGVIGGQAGLGNLYGVGDGSTAKWAEEVAQNNARRKEYSIPEMLPFASDYWTNGEGAAYDLGNALGSSAVLGAETAAVMSGAGAVAGALGIGTTGLAGAIAAGSRGAIGMQQATKMVASMGAGQRAAALGQYAVESVAGRMADKASAMGLNTLSKVLKGPAGKLYALNILRTPFEVSSEMGNAGQDALKDGQSVDEARKRAWITGAVQTPLLAFSNTLETGNLGKILMGDAKKVGGTQKLISALGGITMEAFQNAWEEGMQQSSQEYAADKQSLLGVVNPFQWSPEAKGEAAAGFVSGLGIGGGSAAMNSFSKDTNKKQTVDTPADPQQARDFLTQFAQTNNLSAEEQDAITGLVATGSNEEIINAAQGYGWNPAPQEGEKTTEEQPKTNTPEDIVRSALEDKSIDEKKRGYYRNALDRQAEQQAQVDALKEELNGMINAIKEKNPDIKKKALATEIKKVKESKEYKDKESNLKKLEEKLKKTTEDIGKMSKRITQARRSAEIGAMQNTQTEYGDNPSNETPSIVQSTIEESDNLGNKVKTNVPLVSQEERVQAANDATILEDVPMPYEKTPASQEAPKNGNWQDKVHQTVKNNQLNNTVDKLNAENKKEQEADVVKAQEQQAKDMQDADAKLQNEMFEQEQEIERSRNQSAKQEELKAKANPVAQSPKEAMLWDKWNREIENGKLPAPTKDQVGSYMRYKTYRENQGNPVPSVAAVEQKVNQEQTAKEADKMQLANDKEQANDTQDRQASEQARIDARDKAVTQAKKDKGYYAPRSQAEQDLWSKWDNQIKNGKEPDFSSNKESADRYKKYSTTYQNSLRDSLAPQNKQEQTTYKRWSDQLKKGKKPTVTANEKALYERFQKYRALKGEDNGNNKKNSDQVQAVPVQHKQSQATKQTKTDNKGKGTNGETEKVSNTEFSIGNENNKADNSEIIGQHPFVVMLRKLGYKVVIDKKTWDGYVQEAVNRGDLETLEQGNLIYGAFDNKTNTINLNPYDINLDTPIHEYTHLWVKLIQKSNPKLWAKGKELLKSLNTWKAVENDPHYQSYRKNLEDGTWTKERYEDKIASEVMSRISGIRGVYRMKEMMDNLAKAGESKGLIQKVIDWIGKFFHSTQKQIAPTEDLANMSVWEFINMPVNDVFKGVTYNEASAKAKNNSVENTYSTENQIAEFQVTSGTYFSGGGLVDYALKSIIDGQFAVEKDPKIAGVYKLNNDNHMFNDDVRDFDPSKYKGKVDYFHASPVCKNFSGANNKGGEQPLDIMTAKAVVKALEEIRPKAFTLENVHGYHDSEAMNLIVEALDRLDYNHDNPADSTYNSADFGAATSRDRIMLRAIRKDVGELPAKPKGNPKNAQSWDDALKEAGLDINKLPEKPFAPGGSLIKSLQKKLGDLRKIDKPFLVMDTMSTGPRMAFAGKPAPTILAKGGEQRIFIPKLDKDGKPTGEYDVREASPRVMAILQGLKDYKFPNGRTKTLSYRVVGNGVPVKLTQSVFGPLLKQIDEDGGKNAEFSIGKQAKAIRDKYKGTDKWMKAPNGKSTNLTEDQWCQVRTKNFKDWFGDWENEPENASKIVDENGEPRVMYHQTENEFTTFDIKHNGAGTYDNQTPFGVFLKPTDSNIGVAGNIQMPLFANIKNPVQFSNRMNLKNYLSKNIDSYKEDSESLRNLDKSYQEMFDEAEKEDAKFLKDIIKSGKSGKDIRDAYYNRKDSAESVVEEWEKAANKLREKMKKSVDKHFRDAGYDGVLISQDSGSFGRSTETYIALTPNQVKSATNNNGDFSKQNDDIEFHILDKQNPVEKKKIAELNKASKDGKTFKAYRAMALIDGKLYPPMATKVDSKNFAPASKLGEWEQADENPHRTFYNPVGKSSKLMFDDTTPVKKDGKWQAQVNGEWVDLKTDKNTGEPALFFELRKDNGSTVPARYNPYLHSSKYMLNDQFSSAYNRPNLVVVEMELPNSELTSGYKAEYAKDPVGQTEWKAGPVASQLAKLDQNKARDVYITRWGRPIRIVPDAEVAQAIKEQLGDSGISIPQNVVTPKLAKALKDAGVDVTDTEFSIDSPAFKKWFGNSKLVDKNGKPQVFYRGISERYDVDKQGEVTWITENPDQAEDYRNLLRGYGNDGEVLEVYARVENPLYLGNSWTQHTLSSIIDNKLIPAVNRAFTQDRISSEQGLSLMDKLDELKKKDDKEFKPLFEFYNDVPEILEIIKGAKYDAIKVDEEGNTTYGVIGKSHVKSATNNNGNYDINNDHIEFSAKKGKFFIEKELDEAQRKQVEKYLSESDNKELASYLQDTQFKNTPWARQVADSILWRMAMRELLEGKTPNFENPLSKVKKAVKDIKKYGVDGIMKYVRESDQGFIAKPSKAVYAINASYLNCHPSPDCANFCYAAADGRNYANNINKQEMVNFLIENYPKDAAGYIANAYKTLPSYSEKIALRILDRGELSEKWLPFIKEINKQGVRLQIFSKRPELLRQIDKNNVIMLSVDSSNAILAEQNKDLPLAFVWSGPQDNDRLNKEQQRFEKLGGVILPVKIGRKVLPESVLSQLPKWTGKYTCPIDKGTREIGADIYNGQWNCTRCDKYGTPGCFYGKQTSKLQEKLASLGTNPDMELIDRVINEHADAIIRELKSMGVEISEQKEKQLRESARRRALESMDVGDVPSLGRYDSRNENGENQENGSVPQGKGGTTKGRRAGRRISKDAEFQVVYHGSPYSFEKFMSDHIGDGEGNQSHGWGLYFAKNKDVGKDYRDRLSKETIDANPSLYEVEIPEDSELLNEDLSLDKQPPKVKSALHKLFKILNDRYPVFKEETGGMDNIEKFMKEVTASDFYETTSHIMDGVQSEDDIISELGAGSDKELSLLLNEVGIKGILYDGMQDGPCVVVFDDKAVELLHRYDANDDIEFSIRNTQTSPGTDADMSSVAGVLSRPETNTIKGWVEEGKERVKEAKDTRSLDPLAKGSRFREKWIDKYDTISIFDKAILAAQNEMFLKQGKEMLKELPTSEQFKNRVTMLTNAVGGMQHCLLDGNYREMIIAADHYKLPTKNIVSIDGNKSHVSMQMIIDFLNNNIEDIQGFMDACGNENVIQALDTLVSSEGVLEDYQNYLKKHAQWEHSNKKEEEPTYTFPEGTDKAKFEKVVAKAPMALKQAADMYYKFNNDLIHILRHAGVISEKELKTYEHKYKKFCPLMRDFSDTEALDSYIRDVFGGGGVANVTNPLKHRSGKGSSRNILSPVGSTAVAIRAYITRAERNMLAQDIIKTAKQYKLDTLIKPAKPKAKVGPDESVIGVMVNGKKELYEVDRALYGPLTNCFAPTVKCDIYIAKLAAQTLRVGATTSPGFIIRNFLRDTLTASMMSHYNFIPVVDSLRGAMKLLTDKDFKARFEASGIVNSTQFHSRKDAEKKFLEATNGQSKEYGLVDYLNAIRKYVWGKYSGLNELVEASTRAGLMLKAEEAGATPSQAAYEAIYGTVNFNRSGTAGQQVNKVIPFFNAVIQGGDLLYQEIKRDPKGMAFKIGTKIILPSLVLWLANSDEDWYKELDPNIKMNYWCLPNGVRIQKAEAAVIFGSGIEAMMDEASGKDPKSMKHLKKALWDVFMPNFIPTVMLPLIEWQANYSFFRGKPVVNSAMQKLPDELQYGPYTPAGAIWAGKALGQSPDKIYNLWRSITGTMGTFLLQGTDLLDSAKDNLPEKQFSEKPIARDFLLNPNNYNRSISDFFELYDAANKQHRANGVSGKPTKEISEIQKVHRMISKAYSERKKIEADTKLSSTQKRAKTDKIDKDIKRMARSAVDKYGKQFDIT